MDVEEITSRLVRRFGAQVTDWCANTPALARELAARWSLTLGAPLPPGASSVVLSCRLPDGTPAVLKLSPDQDFLAEQVRMLRWLAPSGRVPRVLAAHPTGMLMGAIEPGIATDELPHPPTVRQWAGLLTALHALDVPPNPPRDLRSRCEESFARIGRRLTDPRIAAQISPTTWNRALDRCRRLLATESTRVLLHGDLHLGNVLDAGPDRGLVAIDPKVCVGDPCFDAVDYLLAAAGDSTTGDAVTARCHALAATHDIDPNRLHAWCRVIAPIIAVSLIPNADNEPAVTELLTLAR
jgi:streptomycin 6-kinase